MDINFKLVSTCTRQDKVNFLPSINLCKDSVEFNDFSGADSTAGVGEIKIKNKSLFLQPIIVGVQVYRL